MVHIVSARLVSDDSARILHEHHVVTLDRRGHGTLLQGTSQLFRIHWRYIDEVGDAHYFTGPVSLAAFTSESFVWVVFLRHDSMVLRIPQRSVHSTTKASFVAIDLRAIDELLLRQVWQLARLKEVSRLNETN